MERLIISNPDLSSPYLIYSPVSDFTDCGRHWQISPPSPQNPTRLWLGSQEGLMCALNRPLGLVRHSRPFVAVLCPPSPPTRCLAPPRLPAPGTKHGVPAQNDVTPAPPGPQTGHLILFTPSSHQAPSATVPFSRDGTRAPVPSLFISHPPVQTQGVKRLNEWKPPSNSMPFLVSNTN